MMSPYGHVMGKETWFRCCKQFLTQHLYLSHSVVVVVVVVVVVSDARAKESVSVDQAAGDATRVGAADRGQHRSLSRSSYSHLITHHKQHQHQQSTIVFWVILLTLREKCEEQRKQIVGTTEHIRRAVACINRLRIRVSVIRSQRWQCLAFAIAIWVVVGWLRCDDDQ
jgi:hypothetical protein